MTDISIATLREKVLRGEAVSLEDTRTLLQSVRRGYKAAAEPKATRTRTPTTKAKAATSNLSLSDIDKLF